jgi:Lrp/AsnC family leucine-responsive transcriptional regulator
MKVAVADVAHLEALLDRLTPYGDLTTSIVLSSPVMRRSISQPSAETKRM